MCIKNPSRSANSAFKIDRKSSLPKQSKMSSSFIQEKNLKDPSIYSTQNNIQSTSPCYSIKYLGITKGQIGILSKRTPIPYLSPLEACKDVPMSLINSSIPNHRTSSRLINKLISIPTQPIDIKPDTQEVLIEKESDDEFPNPEFYDEFVIHTYARPRGLITAKKDDSNIYELRHPPVQIPYHRVGISG